MNKKEVTFYIGSCPRCTCGGLGMRGKGGKCGLTHEREKFESKKELFVVGSRKQGAEVVINEMLSSLLRIEKRRSGDKEVLVADEFRVKFFNLDVLQPNARLENGELVQEDLEIVIHRRERFLRKLESELYARDAKNGKIPEPVYVIGEDQMEVDVEEVIGMRSAMMLEPKVFGLEIEIEAEAINSRGKIDSM